MHFEVRCSAVLFVKCLPVTTAVIPDVPRLSFCWINFFLCSLLRYYAHNVF